MYVYIYIYIYIYIYLYIRVFSGILRHTMEIIEKIKKGCSPRQVPCDFTNWKQLYADASKHFGCNMQIPDTTRKTTANSVDTSFLYLRSLRVQCEHTTNRNSVRLANTRHDGIDTTCEYPLQIGLYATQCLAVAEKLLRGCELLQYVQRNEFADVCRLLEDSSLPYQQALHPWKYGENFNQSFYNDMYLCSRLLPIAQSTTEPTRAGSNIQTNITIDANTFLRRIVCPTVALCHKAGSGTPINALLKKWLLYTCGVYVYVYRQDPWVAYTHKDIIELDEATSVHIASILFSTCKTDFKVASEWYEVVKPVADASSVEAGIITQHYPHDILDQLLKLQS